MEDFGRDGKSSVVVGQVRPRVGLGACGRVLVPQCVGSIWLHAGVI